MPDRAGGGLEEEGGDTERQVVLTRVNTAALTQCKSPKGKHRLLTMCLLRVNMISVMLTPALLTYYYV